MKVPIKPVTQRYAKPGSKAYRAYAAQSKKAETLIVPGVPQPDPPNLFFNDASISFNDASITWNMASN